MGITGDTSRALRTHPIRTDDPEDVDGYISALVGAGKNAGPHLLWNWWTSGELTATMLTELLAWVWPMAEFPEAHLGRRAWLMLFEAAGFVSDTLGVARPECPLEIYRGSTWGRRRGMSWTKDLEKARWFARRTSLYGHNAPTPSGVVIGATIPAASVLAMFMERNEFEVVVSSARLSSVRRLEVVPWVDDA